MIVTQSTTAQQFIVGTGWSKLSTQENTSLKTAFEYFLAKVPLAVLNEPDRSSPWNLPKGPRTRLVSWMQAIQLSEPVNPHRVITAKYRLKQFRFRGDPWSAQGDWFTWLSTDRDTVGLPAVQDADRIFEVTAPIQCMQSRAADAFAGWVPPSKAGDYRHGGGTQLFIYRKSAEAKHLKVVGGAK